MQYDVHRYIKAKAKREGRTLEWLTNEWMRAMIRQDQFADMSKKKGAA